MSVTISHRKFEYTDAEFKLPELGAEMKSLLQKTCVGTDEYQMNSFGIVIYENKYKSKEAEDNAKSALDRWDKANGVQLKPLCKSWESCVNANSYFPSDFKATPPNWMENQAEALYHYIVDHTGGDTSKLNSLDLSPYLKPGMDRETINKLFKSYFNLRQHKDALERNLKNASGHIVGIYKANGEMVKVESKFSSQEVTYDATVGKNLIAMAYIGNADFDNTQVYNSNIFSSLHAGVVSKALNLKIPQVFADKLARYLTTCRNVAKYKELVVRESYKSGILNLSNTQSSMQLSSYINTASELSGEILKYKDQINTSGLSAGELETINLCYKLACYFSIVIPAGAVGTMAIAAFIEFASTQWKSDKSVSAGALELQRYFNRGGNEILNFTPPPRVNVDLSATLNNNIVADGTISNNIRGTNANDTIIVKSGGKNSNEPNKLYGKGGDDVLVGSNGIDRIEGGSGSDSLEGNGGNDELKGGIGNDVYVFGANFGKDTVIDSKNPQISAVNAKYQMDARKVITHDDNLLVFTEKLHYPIYWNRGGEWFTSKSLTLYTEHGTIIIPDFDNSGISRFRVTLANGKTVDTNLLALLQNKALKFAPVKGNTIPPFRKQVSSASSEKIVFGCSSDVTSFSSSGGSLVSEIKLSDGTDIQDGIWYEFDVESYAGYLLEKANARYVEATDPDYENTINMDQAGVFYSSGLNDDTYIYQKGYGNVDIHDNYQAVENGYYGVDCLQFVNIAPAELKFSNDYNQNTFVIETVDGTSKVTIHDEWSQYGRLEQVRFGGTTYALNAVSNTDENINDTPGLYIGTDEDDFIGGTTKSDILYGSSGTNYLAGCEGSDTYVFNGNFGVNHVNEKALNGDINSVAFGDLKFTDLSAFNRGGDLVLASKKDTANEVIINGFFGQGVSPIATFKFADNTTMDATIMKQKALNVFIPAPVVPVDPTAPKTFIKIYYNAELLTFDGNVQGYIKDNYAMVPLHAICDKLGASIQWDAATNKAIITEGNAAHEIDTLQLNNMYATNKGVSEKLNTTAEMCRDKTGKTVVNSEGNASMMSPARYLANIFDLELVYDAPSQTLYMAPKGGVSTDTLVSTLNMSLLNDSEKALVNSLLAQFRSNSLKLNQTSDSASKSAYLAANNNIRNQLTAYGATVNYSPSGVTTVTGALTNFALVSRQADTLLLRDYNVNQIQVKKVGDDLLIRVDNGSGFVDKTTLRGYFIGSSPIKKISLIGSTTTAGGDYQIVDLLTMENGVVPPVTQGKHVYSIVKDNGTTIPLTYPNANLTLDGRAFNTNYRAYIKSGKTMVSVVEFAKMMDSKATVTWDAAEKRAIIVSNGKRSYIDYDDNKKGVADSSINGLMQKMDVAPDLVTTDGKSDFTLMAPVTTLLSIFGLTYKWDDATKTVNMFSTTSVDGNEPLITKPGTYNGAQSGAPYHPVFIRNGQTLVDSSNDKTDIYTDSAGGHARVQITELFKAMGNNDYTFDNNTKIGTFRANGNTLSYKANFSTGAIEWCTFNGSALAVTAADLGLKLTTVTRPYTETVRNTQVETFDKAGKSTGIKYPDSGKSLLDATKPIATPDGYTGVATRGDGYKKDSTVTTYWDAEKKAPPVTIVNNITKTYDSGDNLIRTEYASGDPLLADTKPYSDAEGYTGTLTKSGIQVAPQTRTNLYIYKNTPPERLTNTQTLTYNDNGDVVSSTLETGGQLPDTKPYSAFADSRDGYTGTLTRVGDGYEWKTSEVTYRTINKVYSHIANPEPYKNTVVQYYAKGATQPYYTYYSSGFSSMPEYIPNYEDAEGYRGTLRKVIGYIDPNYPKGVTTIASDGSKTVTQYWLASYTGELSKTVPVDVISQRKIYWAANYSGTVSKYNGYQTVDYWNAVYSGTVYKPVYSGGIKKQETTYWAADYVGTATKQDAKTYIGANLAAKLMGTSAKWYADSSQVELVNRYDGSDKSMDITMNSQNTTAFGDDGNDRISGTDQADKMVGAGGGDILNSNGGDDLIEGGAGNDTLNGGIGNDKLFGDSGNDTYVFDANFGQDIVGDTDTYNTIQFTSYRFEDFNIAHGQNVDDLVLSRKGSTDLLTVKNFFKQTNMMTNIQFVGSSYTYNAIVAEAQKSVYNPTLNSADTGFQNPEINTTVYGLDGQSDILDGGAGTDFLFGGSDADVLGGGAGDDVLRGGSGNDYLTGGAGNDDIYGDAGNDYMEGGLASDNLYGGTGSDAYLVTAASGEKYIYESNGDAGDVDTLTLGFAFNEAAISRSGDDIVIAHKTSDARVVVVNAAVLAGAIEYYNFRNNDGTTEVLNYEQIRNCALYGGGTERNDVLTGSVENDLMNGDSGNDTLLGLQGNDSILGDDGNDTITGGTGDDSLVGGTGIDVYNFNKGDGRDTYLLQGVEDKLQLGTGITMAMLKGSIDGFGNYILTIGDGSDTLTFENWTAGNKLASLKLADNSILTTAQIEELTGVMNLTDGNSTLTATLAIEHTMTGSEGDDTITGNREKDTLMGGAGNDTYIFDVGSGQDVIYENDATASNLDTVMFGSGLLSTDASVSMNGSDLVIAFNGATDSLTIQSYMLGSAYRVEKFQFADGTIWDWNTINAMSINGAGTSNADSVYGTNGDNVLNGFGGNDTLYGYGGNDTLDGGDGNDILDGGLGKDLLTGGTGSNTYIYNVGYGNDTIQTGGGFSNFDYAWSWKATKDWNGKSWVDGGSDAFDDFGRTSIIINGVKYADLNFSKAGVYDVGGVKFRATSNFTSDNLLELSLKAEPGYENAVIQVECGGNLGSDGNENYKTSVMNLGGKSYTYAYSTDTTGNDPNIFMMLMSDTGTTSYTRSRDNVFGNVTGGGFPIRILIIPHKETEATLTALLQNNYKSMGAIDTLRFGPGITKDTLRYSLDGQNLVIQTGVVGDQVCLKDWVKGRGLDRIEFVDGTVMSENELLQLIQGPELGGYLRGVEGKSNVLIGLGSGDGLYGANLADVLDGGAGNDYLCGGVGNDTYIFNAGYGYDGILDLDTTVGNLDTVQFGAGLLASNAIVSLDGTELIIGFAGSTDKLRIASYMTGSAYRVENFRFADGTIWDWNTINAMNLDSTGTTNSENLYGTDGNNTLTGLAGDDCLYGNAGNDILDGGEGNDTFDGGLGNDLLRGGAGSNTYIYNVGYGKDTIQTDGGFSNFDYAWSWKATKDWNGKFWVDGGSDAFDDFGRTSITINGVKYADLDFSKAGVYDVGGVKFRATSNFTSDNLLELSLKAEPGYENAVIQVECGGNLGSDGNENYKTSVMNLGGKSYTYAYSTDTTGNDPNIFMMLMSDTGTTSYTRSRDNVFGNVTGGGFPIRILIIPHKETEATLTALLQNNYKSMGAIDTLRFGPGITKDTLRYSLDGQNLVIQTGVVGDQVCLKDWVKGRRLDRIEFSDGTVMSGNLLPQLTQGTEYSNHLRGVAGTSNVLIGLGGDDRLYGSFFADILDGGTENDWLEGGAGNDTYLFNAGYGQDYIYDVDNVVGNLDTVQFGAGLLASNAIVSLDETELIIGFAGSTDQLSIESYMTGSAYRVENFRFADGTIWAWNTINAMNLDSTGTIISENLYGTDGNNTLTGLAGDDRLYGNAGNDTLDGGEGNDTLDGGVGNDLLRGGAGSNTYIYNRGYGKDIIEVDSGFSFSNLDYAWKWKATKDWTGKLWGDGGSDAFDDFGRTSITINGAKYTDFDFSKAGVYNVGGVKFRATSNFTSGNLLELSLKAEPGYENAVIQVECGGNLGSDGNENYKTSVMNLGGKSYTYAYSTDTTGNDPNIFMMVMSDTGTTSYTRSRDNVFGNVTGGGFPVRIFIIPHKETEATLTELLQNNYKSMGAIDTLRFGPGITKNMLSYSLDGQNLIIQTGTAGDQICLKDWVKGRGLDRIEFADGMVMSGNLLPQLIQGTEVGETLNSVKGTSNFLFGLGGDDILNGTNCADVLDGGSGDDRLYGGCGNNTYIFNSGYGKDVIGVGGEGYNPDAESVDTVEFGAGLMVSNALVSFTGSNLTIAFAGGTDQLTLDFYREYCETRIIKFRFADGTIWDWNTINAMNINSNGTSRPDWLLATSGNNIYDGGGDNDILYGGAGNDTYLFNGAFGSDTLSNGNSLVSDNDKAVFGYDRSKLIFSRSVNDLKIQVAGQTDNVLVQNWYLGGANTLKEIDDNNASAIQVAGVDQLVQAMATFTTTTGISWEQAALQNNQQYLNILSANYKHV